MSKTVAKCDFFHVSTVLKLAKKIHYFSLNVAKKLYSLQTFWVNKSYSLPSSNKTKSAVFPSPSQPNIYKISLHLFYSSRPDIKRKRAQRALVEQI